MIYVYLLLYLETCTPVFMKNCENCDKPNTFNVSTTFNDDKDCMVHLKQNQKNNSNRQNVKYGESRQFCSRPLTQFRADLEPHERLTISDATIYRPNDISSRYLPYRIVSISS